jgi:hypothetical protein
MPQIIAGPVRAILMEFGVEAVKRASMQTRARTLDNPPRGELQILDRGNHRGI